MEAKNTFFYKNTTVNCRGRILDIHTPKVMGIINVTPDSFFSGSKYTTIDAVLASVEKMLEEGADIIDVGGMSSRPGAEVIALEEELQRVVPVVEKIYAHFPEAIISIDTVRARVAEEAVGAGAAIINDISAGKIDAELITTVARLQVPYILMHMQGLPQHMQKQPVYHDVALDILDFLIDKVAELRSHGIKDIIIDPGFGFGKTLEQNWELLRRMDELKVLELPVLVGISRKSMICQALKVNPAKALNGTTAAHVLALQRGADILRVHDVKEAREVIRSSEFMKN